MAYHASPSFAPSTHPHVSYTSHPHCEDVNNSIGAYSEAGDYSEANLEVRMTGLETEVRDLKIGMTGLRTEVKEFKTEMKDFKTEIFHQIDKLGTKFESSLKEIAHTNKEQLSSFAQWAQLLRRGKPTPYLHPHRTRRRGPPRV
jgi:hypothetical protein